MAVKEIWNPAIKGLSVSALNLFWTNPVAFELKYFQGLEPVEPWNKNMAYGSLIGAGIEGWIKHRTLEAVSTYVNNQYVKDITKYNEHDEITWWAELAVNQARLFVEVYEADFDKYGINSAETRNKVTIELPASGRSITLSGYFDGQGTDTIFEHKCRGDWDTEKIANEIDLDLQFNFYVLLYYAKHLTLPKRVWYQHSRRPSGFAYRGPRQGKNESRGKFLERTIEYVRDHKEDHFYQFIARPSMDRFNRFLDSCLFPKLEQFLDWYQYMVSDDKDKVNSLHVMTPYGMYNPYLEGTNETFRNYAMTGSTLGLRKKYISEKTSNSPTSSSSKSQPTK